MKRIVYLLSGVAVLVLLVAGVTWRHTEGAAPSVPEKLVYCGTCHSMEKEVTTWQSSAHKDVACLECHLESDVAWVRHEFQDEGGTMAGKEPTKAVHTLPLKAPDDRCTECHQPQMEQVMKDITPARLVTGMTNASGNSAPGKAMAVMAKHDLHVNGQKMACSECHIDSAHGATLGTPEWVEQQHQLCQTCHSQKNVVIKTEGSSGCAACHTAPAMVAPADHKNGAVWQRDHSKAAATQNCSACHLPTKAGVPTPVTNPSSVAGKSADACFTCHGSNAMPHPDGFLAIHGQESLKAGATCTTCHSSANRSDPTADYAQDDFCINCHSGLTMPHPEGYLTVHGQDAARSSATCTACHSPANPANPTAAHAGASYCVNCHAQPMPHPSNYLSAHGQQAMKAPATCEACHSRKNPAKPNADHASQVFCSTCHDQYQHPAGWVAGHGDKTDSTCATCHTLVGQPGQHNACSACHTGSAWHPDMWWVSHAREVNANGSEGCMKCHNEVEPSCTKCHRQ